jgi:hypothetical protein
MEHSLPSKSKVSTSHTAGLDRMEIPQKSELVALLCMDVGSNLKDRRLRECLPRA